MRDVVEHILPDYLKSGLDVVFVGTVVGDVSAEKQHYYAGYTNAFYKCIYQAGIVPEPFGFEDDWKLNDYGIGFTDLVKHRHTGDDTNLTSAELSDGVPFLKEKILKYQPRFVCFTSKTGYNAFAGPGRHHYGLTGKSIGSSQVFVVPSPSGRVHSEKLFDGKTRLQWFEALAGLIRNTNSVV